MKTLLVVVTIAGPQDGNGIKPIINDYFGKLYRKGFFIPC